MRPVFINVGEGTNVTGSAKVRKLIVEGDHPAALPIARQQGWSQQKTHDVMESALPPAATVILVTGAGGVFAKVLTATGIGAALSGAITEAHLPLLLAGFVISLALRAAQTAAQDVREPGSEVRRVDLGLPGGSMRVTPAPQSASSRTAAGPARAIVRSSTR